jgi:HTH-type transcriptional regulator/antitoxin HigA
MRRPFGRIACSLSFADLRENRLTTATASFDIAALQRTWRAFDRMAHLRPIRTRDEYERTVALMNALLDVVGDREDHALSGLLDLVSELVGDYDAAHFAIGASEPREVLRYLIEARGLRQSDLAGVVAQGNLSAILAGKRRISAALAGKLGRYFGVSPAAFVPG